jgi:hypothetical protein
MYKRTWHDRVRAIIHVTLSAKIYPTQIVLGRVINLGDTTNITGMIINVTRSNAKIYLTRSR